MRRLTGLIAWLAVGGAVLAEPYQIQQGNVLDRNPQLGSGGFNSGGRQYQFNTSSRIVTGNVTNGAAFRGFSPISDPSAFGLSNSSLPSAGLSNFRRDTYSIGDAQAGRPTGYTVSPYYSLSRTVVNTGGIVQGLNQPGTSQIRSSYLPPTAQLRAVPYEPLDAATGSGLLGVSPRVERVDSGRALTGQINDKLLSSPLFGAVRAIPADQLAAQAAADQRMGTSLATQIDNRIEPQAPMNQQVMTQRDARVFEAGPKTSPLEMLLGVNQPSGPPDRTTTGKQTEATRANPGLLNPGKLPDTSVPPADLTSPAQAADMFAGMRQMRGELVQPLQTTKTLAEVTQADRDANAKLRKQIRPPGKVSSETFAQDTGPLASRRPFQAGPLRTFVGTQQSAMNRYLREAESRIRRGEYYKAAEYYEIARPLDLKNPLPLLGRALALLAAGEYVSSASSLFQAIDTYEALADFPVDLPAFIPDINMLDRRRADLEQRLARNDDFRLRFLLGYAEYCSGMQKLGMQDMTKAANAAPAELDSLRHFVSLLSLHPVSSATSRPAR